MSATINTSRTAYAVVGVDGSAASGAAVDWALAEAQRRELDLEIVGVWQAPLVVAGPSSAIAVPTMMRVARHHAEHSVEEAAKRAADAGVHVTTEVLEGSAGEVLLELSRAADQLVVGDRGAGPMARFLLGSVSTAVAHHAVAPVTVVRRHHGPPQHRVVAGVDGSDCSRLALRRAAVEARAAGAELHVVSALGPFESSTERALAHLLEQESEALRDCRVHREVVEGHPVDVLVRAAEHADLLVVGTRGRGAFDRMLLGSISTACLHHAPCPIQVVPDRV